LATFSVIVEQYPLNSLRPHKNAPVDCAKFYGDFIFSKPYKDKILLWYPYPSKHNSDKKKERITVVNEYNYNDNMLETTNEENNIMEQVSTFALDPQLQYLAVGDNNGDTFLWNIETKERQTFHHPKCSSPIKCVAFNYNSTCIICCCADGTLWRYDVMH